MTYQTFVLIDDIFHLALLVVFLSVCLFVLCLLLVALVAHRHQGQAWRFQPSEQSRVTPLGYWSKQQNKRVVPWKAK